MCMFYKIKDNILSMEIEPVEGQKDLGTKMTFFSLRNIGLEPEE